MDRLYGFEISYKNIELKLVELVHCCKENLRLFVLFTNRRYFPYLQIKSYLRTREPKCDPDLVLKDK